MPLVSVVIPSYNRGYCIEQAVRSALDQTFGDMEVLVVDDASKDDTRQRVLAIPDPRIRYLAHESNRGGAAARNSGIAAAAGEFVAFLDSDDRWAPGKLQSQVSALQRLGPQRTVSFTWLSCVDDADREIGRVHPDIEGEWASEILVCNFIGTFSNVVASRSLLLQVGALDEELRSCQDWDLFIRLSRHTSLHCLREYAVKYRKSVSDKNRISTNSRSVVQGHDRILQKHAAAYAGLPAAQRKLASRTFMQAYADAGHVSGVMKSAAWRAGAGVSIDETRDSARLFARSMKRRLMSAMGRAGMGG